MEILILIGLLVGVFWFLSSRKNRRKQIASPRREEDEFSHLYDKGPSVVIRIDRDYYEEEGDDSVSPGDVWVPHGKPTTIAGRELRGGMLYVGQGLKSVRGRGVEPALINPKLKVNNNRPDRSGSTMVYWPSYSKITPEARAGYLEWLSSGRHNPSAYIGYVFLYFYGLERRVLVDAKNEQLQKDELRKILGEVKRLLDIYGKNNSFNSYASRLLDFAMALHFPSEYMHMIDKLNSPYGELAFGLKYAIARIASEGKPLDANTALAFIENDPLYPFRTPAKRCRDEFRDLFRLRYEEVFSGGCQLKSNRTRLKASYHAASGSFGGEYSIQLGDLSDVTVLKQPWQKLRELADTCTDELDAFSRFLGRNPRKPDGAEAYALLPDVLFKSRLSGKGRELSNWIDQQSSGKEFFNIKFSDLFERLPYLSKGKFNKREAVSLAQFLEKLGYGIEPDVRFFGKVPKNDQPVVLFKLQSCYEAAPSDQFAHAALMVELAAMVAVADGTVSKDEELHLQAHLENQLHLSKSERSRLRARLEFCFLHGGQTTIAKKTIEMFDDAQRQFIGSFIAGIARADDNIDPAEIRTLEKLYRSLGLDILGLYSSLHQTMTEPVTVINPERGRTDFTIPLPPKELCLGVELDKNAIAAKLQEAASVSTLLNTIFTDEDGPLEEALTEETHLSIEGLDPDASMLLGKILKRQTWERSELEAIAAESNIMLDGTIDSINDACIESFGEPILEGDETLEVNEYVAKELAI